MKASLLLCLLLLAGCDGMSDRNYATPLDHKVATELCASHNGYAHLFPRVGFTIETQAIIAVCNDTTQITSARWKVTP